MHKLLFSQAQKTLPTMRNIIVSTMELLSNRQALRPDYGWIDTKIDPITGKDYFDAPDYRGKEYIYSWIQGRGLEAITTHLIWFEKFCGIPTVQRERLTTLAHSVAHKIQEEKILSHGHVGFLLGEKRPLLDNRYTMSDLFCTRGLYAYTHLFGSEREQQLVAEDLKQIIRGIISGNFTNDQQAFGTSQYRITQEGIQSYGGHMLALGAVTLLIQMGKDRESFSLGKMIVDYIIETYCNCTSRWETIPEYTLVEYTTLEGDLARNPQGYIVVDPGHAIEFVGLTAHMIQVAQSHLSLELNDNRWISHIKSLLSPILQVQVNHGYRTPGGLLKHVDAERGIPLQDSMPWWSLPETMRAIALVENLCHRGQWSSWAERWFTLCLHAFVQNYSTPSCCAIAIQTINLQGEAVPIIPATPDLDPGYHTGLSLICCYDVIAQGIPVAMEATQIDITPSNPTFLCGHRAREGKWEQVLDPLYARLCFLQTPYTHLVILSLDLLELSSELVTHLRERLSEVLPITQNNCILCTTHTHTAPPVIDLGALQQDVQYTEYVVDRIVLAAATLGKSMRFMSLQTVQYDLPLGINRRYKDPITNKVRMKPNPLGSCDNRILATIFRDSEDVIRVVWIHTAVHPTTLGVSFSVISADYPGAIVRHIASICGKDAVVIPFTGACADVRPALLTATKDSFREGNEEDIDHMGTRVKEGLIHALTRTKGETYRTIKDIRYSHKEISLSFSSIPKKEDLLEMQRTLPLRVLEAQAKASTLDEFSKKHDNPLWEIEVEHSWTLRLLKAQKIASTTSMELSVVSLDTSLLMCFIPGELFSAVGKRIQAMYPYLPIMVVGYAHGSLGYLPSKEAVTEGGYEVDIAYKFYGLPGPFTDELEDQIISNLFALLHTVLDD